MNQALVEKLGSLRAQLAPLARRILGLCQDLGERADAAGLTDYDDELRRTLFAARELERRIDDLLDPLDETFARHAGDLKEAAARLRHDLRNAVGAVRGYVELMDDDLKDAGDDSLASELADLIAETLTLEKLIASTIDFSDIAATAGNVADAGPDITIYMTDAPLDNPVPIKGRILVVDDDAVSRELTVARLERDGHTVDAADNGMDALARMRETDFDVVLLDLMMPGMSGFEVLAQMRKSAVLRRVRVIVVSGLDQEENAIKCIGMGAEDYLAKPVNPILLRARLGSSLARKQWRDQERLYLLHLEAEKTKSDALLLNTLPELVVKRLSSGEKVIADAYDDVTVLFSDFANFTGFAAQHTAEQVVEVLNRVFTEFDLLAMDLGAEKIKTIGDGYLAVGGLPVPRPDHAEIMADMAIGMIDTLESLNRRFGTNLEIRIGLNSGPVVAGIIGTHKFAYDIWGHTVNSAARHESYSMPQHIHVSSQTAALLKGKFKLIDRGILSLRGIGDVQTYFLDGRTGSAVIGEPEDVAEPSKDEPYSVLIADDDDDIQLLMARRIRRKGWDAEVVSDGAEAWAKLQHRRFDLLITDCDMPVVDGFELTEMIRRSEKNTGRHMGIIAVTGSDTREFAQRCLSVGVDGFLRKPVMWVELEECIRRLREDGRQQGAA